MNSEKSIVEENSATAASVTNTVIMDNHDNTANIIKVVCENNAIETRPANNRSNDNDYWAEIENEDLILNLGPPVIVATKTSEESIPESSPSPISTSTMATTVESVTSRLLRKRDELAKKYGIGEGKHEQTDNKVDLSETNDEVETSVCREQTLDEFKEDLRLKRLARQTAVQDLRNEIHTLQNRLVENEAETIQLKQVKLNKDEENLYLNAVKDSNADADDEDPMSRGRHANIELANVQLALQMANAENLTLSTELATVQKQVVALKEVICCCKQMLAVKEDQCTQIYSHIFYHLPKPTNEIALRQLPKQQQQRHQEE